MYFSLAPLLDVSAEIGYVGHQRQTTLVEDLKKATQALEELELHSTVTQCSAKLFRGGHYAQAVFESLKALESCVKTVAGFPKDPRGNELYGRPLIMKVFDVDSPLIQISDDANVSTCTPRFNRGFGWYPKHIRSRSCRNPSFASDQMAWRSQRNACGN